DGSWTAEGCAPSHNSCRLSDQTKTQRRYLRARSPTLEHRPEAPVPCCGKEPTYVRNRPVLSRHRPLGPATKPRAEGLKLPSTAEGCTSRWSTRLAPSPRSVSLARAASTSDTRPE